MSYSIEWANVDLKKIPHIQTSRVPGPKSLELHGRAAQIMKGYSGQVRLFPVVFEKGYGCTLTDVDGNIYLDFSSGIYVTTLGHCHPKVVEAIRRQAGELIHMDNTFYNEPQGRLAELLSERAFGGKCFFCNSGAEAVEAALKLARRYTEPSKYKIITAEGGFHARTFGAVTATAQPRYHRGFLPLVPGFVYVPFNDVEALEAAFDEEVAAVLVEPVQGEGGIRVASKEYLERIRQLCAAHGALAIWDEVQSGMGRTGRWFAYQHWGVEPDMMTLAKALGGGAPIGALIAREEVAASMTPGSHASTYGANPLVVSAAIATIETIEQQGLLARAEQMGQYIMDKARALADKLGVITEVRGKGLMIGLELSIPAQPVVDAALRAGLRINATQQTVLRMLPAMTVTHEQVDEAFAILEQVLRKQAGLVES